MYFLGVTSSDSMKYYCVCGVSKTIVNTLSYFNVTRGKKKKKWNELSDKYDSLLMVKGGICLNCHNVILYLSKNAKQFRE